LAFLLLIEGLSIHITNCFDVARLLVSDFNQVVLRLSGEPLGAHPRRRSDSIGMPPAFLRRPLVPAVIELSN
jgi:hypothetical protein